MAGCAGSRPASCDVIWICRSREVRLVTGVAICRSTGKDVIDMALIAGYCHVSAREREGCAVVVEGSAGPGSCGVAGVACGGEAGCGMVRIGRSIPIRLMAAITCCGKCRVVIVHVARSTRSGHMGAGQREWCAVVIEGRRAPAARGMADGTIGWESRSDVFGLVVPVKSAWWHD